MRASVVPLSLLVPAAPATQAAAVTSSAAKELHALFESEWERGLREDPLRASYPGDSRYDDRWPDLSADGLSDADRLNRDLFTRRYRGAVDEYE